MDDLHTILTSHRVRRGKRFEEENRDVALDDDKGELRPQKKSSGTLLSSEIPDLFFDYILVHYKLTRIETLVLMYLYRAVWCRPNLYQVYGISPLLSHTEMSKNLETSIEDIYLALRKLESFGFISTVRSGQYFVRKFFCRHEDEIREQTYDDFEI